MVNQKIENSLIKRLFTVFPLKKPKYVILKKSKKCFDSKRCEKSINYQKYQNSTSKQQKITKSGETPDFCKILKFYIMFLKPIFGIFTNLKLINFVTQKTQLDNFWGIFPQKTPGNGSKLWNFW